MTQDEFTTLVLEHKLWIETLGKEGRQLTGQDLDLRGRSLIGVTLAEVVLPGSDMSFCQLTHADLYAGNFASCRFESADLSFAKLSKGNFDYANFQSARLCSAVAVRASFIETSWEWASLDKADLSGAELAGADLRSASLQGCNLSRADLTSARVSKASLAGALGLKKAVAKNIIICDADRSSTLSGSAALDWLKHISER